MSKKDKIETAVDEESARLLEEMNAIPAQVEPPILPEPEAPAMSEGDPDRVIVNRSKNSQRIGGVVVPVGGRYYLTDADMRNERLLQRVEYGIKIKVLSRGAG